MSKKIAKFEVYDYKDNIMKIFNSEKECYKYLDKCDMDGYIKKVFIERFDKEIIDWHNKYDNY